MYAKLAVGNINISAMNAMRDIGRLITSTAPSTARSEEYTSELQSH